MPKKFNGLNVSSKLGICGMPIRIDSYKGCSFGCRYCFANARVIMAFDQSEIQICDIDSVKRTIDRAEKGRNRLLERLIASGITWHMGGMSDPLQPCEAKHGITRRLLALIKERGLSVLLSTKSDTVYDCELDPACHAVQLSVTNVQNRRDIEPNVPSIERRISFFHELKRAGVKVGIRIQPFIPGIASLDIVKAFDGADHFIIEGVKGVPQNKAQRDFIRNELGIPDSAFTQMGLLNLKRDIRLQLYEPFLSYFKAHNISYSISDNDIRELSSDRCCCGDALIRKASGMDITALAYDGRLEDLEEPIRRARELGIADCDCRHLFTSNRCHGFRTVEEMLRSKQETSASPANPVNQSGKEPYQPSLFRAV